MSWTMVTRDRHDSTGATWLNSTMHADEHSANPPAADACSNKTHGGREEVHPWRMGGDDGRVYGRIDLGDANRVIVVSSRTNSRPILDTSIASTQASSWMDYE
jgi:hypothetical protein